MTQPTQVHHEGAVVSALPNWLPSPPSRWTRAITISMLSLGKDAAARPGAGRVQMAGGLASGAQPIRTLFPLPLIMLALPPAPTVCVIVSPGPAALPSSADSSGASAGCFSNILANCVRRSS